MNEQLAFQLVSENRIYGTGSYVVNISNAGHGRNGTRVDICKYPIACRVLYVSTCEDQISPISSEIPRFFFWGSNFCRSFKISTGEPEFLYSPENYCNLEPENRPGPKKETIWVFPKIGVSQNGCFLMENLIKMDDFGWFSNIFGNTHIVFQSSIFREGINPSSWVSILVPGYQS